MRPTRRTREHAGTDGELRPSKTTPLCDHAPTDPIARGRAEERATVTPLSRAYRPTRATGHRCREASCRRGSEPRCRSPACDVIWPQSVWWANPCRLSMSHPRPDSAAPSPGCWHAPSDPGARAQRTPVRCSSIPATGGYLSRQHITDRRDLTSIHRLWSKASDEIVPSSATLPENRTVPPSGSRSAVTAG